MRQPDFTDKERRLIHYVLSMTDDPWRWAWVYVLPGGIMFGFGVYLQNLPLMTAAFLVVSGIRLYEALHSTEGYSLWQSIINKYEAAIASTRDDNHAVKAGLPPGE